MFFSMQSWSRLKGWSPTFEQILAVADWIVVHFSNSTAARAAKKAGDDYLARSILFIRDALLFSEFESAVSFADPGRVLHVLKYWTFSFRGAGMHNYARECLEVLMRWKYELNEAHRAAMERAWFVNKFGLPGRWIAADLYIEHLNYWIKVRKAYAHREYVAQGSNLTEKYIIEKGSACVEAFREISKHVSKLFGNSERQRRHKEVQFHHDLEALVNDLVSKAIHVLTADRNVYPQGKIDTLSATEDTSDNMDLPNVRKSGVNDLFILGAAALQGGKFNEFIRDSLIDPELGYPLKSSEAQTVDTQDDADPDVSTASDNTHTENDVAEAGLVNPKVIETTQMSNISEADVDLDGVNHEPDCPGIGGLGGGGEYD